MSIIEITAEQADQFRAAGIRVRFAIHPEDLTRPVMLPPPPAVIEVDVKPITRVRKVGAKFTQQYRKGTLVRLADNWEQRLAAIPGDSKRYDVYAGVALVLSDHVRPMLRHKLWKATGKFLGKQYTSISSTLTDMLREGFLVVVGP